MAEKVSTLVIEVECVKCCKKIQKILCKLQEQEKIKSICYDTEKNTFTISGPFDPQKLSEKLKCKAKKACLDIKITIPKEKKPDPKDKPGAENKPDAKGQKEPDGKKPPEPKEAATASASTTVNLRFSQVCQICYPWPCNDPNHLVVPPQKWPCHDVPVPSSHQCPQNWGVPPRPCGGSSYCGGCGSCGGGGCPVKPPPVCWAGPSCRGCNGCRIIHEEKFRYEEYPPSLCAIM